MGNLNGKQIIGIGIAVLGALMVSNGPLTDLFGAAMAKTIVSGAGLMNLILGSVMAALTGQGALVKDVLNMPGVEKIAVNEQANKTLAAIAIDPAQDKIAPTRDAAAVVNATAGN